MLNVFVISSDKRVASLIEHFQPFFKTKIRSASDFDNGLKEVFENRPTVVFIQSTIGTVSGDTVSRHIKSLLGSASPRIVFMGDSDSNVKKGTSWCDDWISISDSPQQLQQDFADLISRSFPEDWLGIQKEMEKTAPGPAVTDQGDRRSAVVISDDGESQKEQIGASEFDIFGKVDEISVQQKTVGSGTDVLGPDKGTLEEEEFPAYQNLYEDPSLANVVSPSKRRFVGRLLTVLFLLAGVGCGVYFWLLRAGDSKPAAAPPPAATVDHPVSTPAKIRNGINGIPSFVHSEWRDAPYTAQHPGWERYVSPEMEFRIFREKDTIKALQGISLSRKGISEPVLVQILEQLGINGPLPEGKDTLKNGFLEKSIVFPGVAELVIYHEQGGPQIKAFVLEFF